MLQVLIRNAAALSLAAAAGLCWAAGTVEVKFIDAAKFTDGGKDPRETERTTDTLGARLKSFGKQLPDGQILKVDVIDVDLAGRVSPTAQDLRVVTGQADWPRIKLRYTLLAGDKTLKSGEDSLADMDYLSGAKPRKNPGGYDYELRMLDTWFKERFAAP